MIGNSFEFLGKEYSRGKREKLQINDEVICHPVPGRSEATKAYPCKVISTKKYNDVEELELIGIRENSNWHGALINEYCFNRLEFVKHENT